MVAMRKTISYQVCKDSWDLGLYLRSFLLEILSQLIISFETKIYNVVSNLADLRFERLLLTACAVLAKVLKPLKVTQLFTPIKLVLHVESI